MKQQFLEAMRSSVSIRPKSCFFCLTYGGIKVYLGFKKKKYGPSPYVVLFLSSSLSYLIFFQKNQIVKVKADNPPSFNMCFNISLTQAPEKPIIDGLYAKFGIAKLKKKNVYK